MRATGRITAGGLAAVLALAGLGACASGGGATGGGAAGAPAAGGGTAPTGRAAPVKVVWQALAHERYLYENPRIRRGAVGTATPDLHIVLVNESHPEAQAIEEGATDGSTEATGVISDADMTALVQGFRQIGFFRAARSTSAQAALFDLDTARGRVTVEQGGRSLTVLSVRGQGLDERTRHIPKIYSQAKQAVAMMRNRTPTLRVEAIGRGPVPTR